MYLGLRVHSPILSGSQIVVLSGNSAEDEQILQEKILQLSTENEEDKLTDAESKTLGVQLLLPLCVLICWDLCSSDTEAAAEGDEKNPGIRQCR